MRNPIFLVIPVAVCVAACGGGSSPPTTPSTPQPPAPTQWSLSGRLLDTVTGDPVGGASLTFTGYPAVTTAGDGAWELQGTGTATPRLAVTIEAAGYVKRETGVTWTLGGRRDVMLDVISDRAPFSLTFYRELVRNGHEAPETLQPLRRWTRAPNFYINTTDPKSGGSMRPSEIDMLQQVIRDTVPQLTGGLFSAGTIDLGSTPRDRQPDFINVVFVYDPTGDYCGKALVGANPGEITINYDRCRDACGAFSPDTIAHEVGHAMGFWHVQATSIMNLYGSERCSNSTFSPDERLHARVAYGRTPGNRELDLDPLNFASIGIGGDAPAVICRRSSR